MSVQIKVLIVGLVTSGFLMYKLIYCIHLHIHMCTVYIVSLWSLSFILVRGTFLLFYVLTFTMYILVF